MSTVQSTYASGMAAGRPGLIANMELSNVISRTAAGAIAFGMPVIRSGDHSVVIADEPAFTGVGAAGVPAPAGATITAAPAVVAPAKVGVYRVECIVGGATTTSKWRVTDPDGEFVGIATGDTEFIGGGLTFTVTDAGTDPVAGEAFTITVTSNEGGEFLGISVRDVTLDPSNADAFAQYDTVPVLTKGVIWVTAGATVAVGDVAYWDDADSRYTNVATDYPIPGGRFESAGGDGDIVQLSIRPTL